MPRIPGIRRLFRLDVLAPPVERDVDEELAFHFDHRIAELEARGLSAAAARAEAERRFGDVQRYRGELAVIDHARSGAARRLAALDAITHDLRYAVRGLVRRPGFSLAIVIMLALGIGANATMFGVVDRLLLRPPPHVVAPEQLRHIQIAVTPDAYGGVPMGGFSPAQLRDLRTSLAGLADVAASSHQPGSMSPGNMTLGSDEHARPVRGVVVTGSYLPLLGVRPVLGRLLQPADDTLAGTAPAVVIGHGLWQRALGGARDVVGKPLRVDGAWYTVAGVLPPDFRGVEAVTPDVWLPLGPAIDNAALRRDSDKGGDEQRLYFIARLWPDVAEAAVAARASLVLATEEDARHNRGRSARAELQPLRPLMSVVRDKDGMVAVLLAGMSTLLLLIACASVANLLLARGLERGREMAVRITLGVSRRRLVLQLLADGVLLTAAAALAALAVVHWSSLLLQSLLFGAVGATERPVDLRVLAFTGGVALLTGVLAGLAPALQASRPSLLGALRRGVQEGGGRRASTRTVFAAVQTALCVVLLVGTGLFVRSLRAVHAVPLGFDAERVLVGSYDLREVGYDTTRVHALFASIVERARALPGVRAVGISNGVPLERAYFPRVQVDGDSKDDHPASPTIYHVSPDYLAAIGVNVLRGRGLTDADRADGMPVTVVSASMAGEFWPTGNAIGGCVRIGADTMPCTTVVGIVEDVIPLQVTEDLVRPQFYVPLAQVRKGRDLALFVRIAPAADPRSIATTVRSIMQTAAPDLPFADVATLADDLGEELRPWRLGSALFGAFGAIALVIAALGLYGVLAFGVAQRRHEIGVRLALGATGGRVLRLVVGQGVAVAAGGVAAGVLLALAGGPLVADLLYRTSPSEPAVFAGVVAVLLLVALAASVIPAWRASRVPPADALRAD